MKTASLVVIAATYCGLAPISRAQDIATMPPVVVKTVPEAGSENVAPGVLELRVTFSKEMLDKSWSPSTAWEDSIPAVIGEPRYESDRKTWVVKVRLEPGMAYGYWLNSQKFGNFKDAQGLSAVPYLLTFKTAARQAAPGAGEKDGSAPSMEQAAQSAAERWLSLTDAGKHDESWQAAAASFQSAVAKAQWETSLRAARKPLGELGSRKLKSAQTADSLPGAPDGKYVVMLFETSFAEKKAAVETVTFMLEKDGQWRAAGYFIR